MFKFIVFLACSLAYVSAGYLRTAPLGYGSPLAYSAYPATLPLGYSSYSSYGSPALTYAAGPAAYYKTSPLGYGAGPIVKTPLAYGATHYI